MIRINLLPVREARRRADLRQQATLLMVLSLGTLLVIGYAHLSLHQGIRQARKRVAETQAKIKEFGPQLEKVDAYKKKKKEIQQKLDVIASLDRSRSGPVRVLDEIATRTPDRLWLTQLTADGHKLGLTGKSLDNEIVALFLTHLNDSPYFQSVELKKTELETSGGIKLHAFQVDAQIKDPNAPEVEQPKGKKHKKAGKRAKAGQSAAGG